MFYGIFINILLSPKKRLTVRLLILNWPGGKIRGLKRRSKGYRNS